jgi:integrase
MARITKAIVERAQTPARGQIFIRDGQILGFAVRITEGGTKSFIWEGRAKGRMRRITIGQFPDVSVVEARKAGFGIRAAIARGEDPAQNRSAIRTECTFTKLANEYLERHAKPLKRSWREDDALLRNHVPSGWRNRKLSDISREDVLQLRDAISRKIRSGKRSLPEEGMPYAANHMLRLLRTMFNLARDWGLLRGENPAARIRLLPETRRDRFLSPDELARVNFALDQEPNQYWRAYFVLSLLLGTRKTELLSARWSDVDLMRQTLRIPRTKTGRPHLLPLPSPAVSILESLPSHNSNEWVFPSADSKSGHLMEPKKAWHRIRKSADVSDVRIHDLRRTLGSWLAASGYSLPLIGRALNHSNVSTTAIYSRLDLDPVRQALEHNAKMMLSASIRKSESVKTALLPAG